MKPPQESALPLTARGARSNSRINAATLINYGCRRTVTRLDVDKVRGSPDSVWNAKYLQGTAEDRASVGKVFAVKLRATTAALALAVFAATGAMATPAMAQPDFPRPSTAYHSNPAVSAVRRSTAPLYPIRGSYVRPPVLSLAPPVMRIAPPITRRMATRVPAVSLPMLPLRSDSRAPRTLSFVNVHTRESITLTYTQDGSYVTSELSRLSRFLRDSRDETQVAIDPRLLDILWEVRQRLGSKASYHVLSGYRSPRTNAWLASVSSGVASNSLHMRGQAMDVMLPDRTAAQIGAEGLALKRGGVGYYPTSGFVHLDTGPVRFW